MSVFFCNSFSAGMNEVLDPAFLTEKTAALLLNADISTGKIQSLKKPKLLSVTSPDEVGHYGRIDRSTIKIYERTYWSNNNALKSPFYGGNIENYLGIPYPDYANDVKIETVSGDLTGEYKYCVTYVNPNGWESAPGSVTDYERIVKFESNYAKITVTWQSDIVAYAKIYRTANNGADFFCVGEIHASGDSFTDNIDDLSLSGMEPLSSIDNYPPPEGGKYLCESGGVFFLAVGSTLWFSVQGNPHAWPLLNFIAFDDTIRGITAEFQGVLVFTANNTYRITGASSVETIIKQTIPGNQGCVKNTTIAQISNAPIWLSNDGICLWNGESITVISRQIINTTRLQVVCAVSANDCYYLFLENGAIVYDHRNGDIFTKLDFTCRYAWYDANTDFMYLQRDNGIFLFGAGNQSNYSYLSGYIGVPESTFTFYKEVIITIDGNAEVVFTVEGKQVFAVDIYQAGKHRIKIPYNTIGRYAQVKVNGTGTLKEISVVYGD